MKKAFCILAWLPTIAGAQLTPVFTDDFEDGTVDAWWSFNNTPGTEATGVLTFSRQDPDYESRYFCRNNTGLGVADVAYASFEISNFTLSGDIALPLFRLTTADLWNGVNNVADLAVGEDGTYQVFVNNSADPLDYNDGNGITGTLAAEHFVVYKDGTVHIAATPVPGANVSAGDSMRAVGWVMFEGNTSEVSFAIDNFELYNGIDVTAEPVVDPRILEDTFGNGDARVPEYFSGGPGNYWSNDAETTESDGNLIINLGPGAPNQTNTVGVDSSELNFFARPTTLELRGLSITGTGYTPADMAARIQILALGTVGWSEDEGIFLEIRGDGTVTGTAKANGPTSSWGDQFFQDNSTYGDNEVSGFDLTLDGTSGTEVAWSLTIYGTSEVSNSGTLAITPADWNGGDNSTKYGFWIQPSNNTGTETQTVTVSDFNIYEVITEPEITDFEITAFDYDPDTNVVTFIWPSQPGETFGVYSSTDLSDWGTDLNDNIPAADPGTSTSAAFDLDDYGVGDIADLFFRVVRQ